MASGAKAGWIPAEPGIWAVIFGDLVVFAILFGNFAWYHHLDPGLFDASQARLDRTLGLVNTIVLLTSSALMAFAVSTTRRAGGATPRARRAIVGAALLGLVFVALKMVEWRAKFAAGLTVETNDFFMYYFIMCGIHLLHVCVGIGLLSFAAASLRPDGLSQRSLEGIGIFWHLIDLLWVFLFAILYLA